MIHMGLMIFCRSSSTGFLPGSQGVPSAYLTAQDHSLRSCEEAAHSTQLSFSASTMRRQSPGPVALLTPCTFLIEMAPTTVMSSFTCVN